MRWASRIEIKNKSTWWSSSKTVLLGFTFLDGLDTTPPGTIEQPESEHGSAPNVSTTTATQKNHSLEKKKQSLLSVWSPTRSTTSCCGKRLLCKLKHHWALGSLEPPPEPLLLLPLLLYCSLWANRPYDTSLQDVDKSLEQKFTKTLFPCSKPQAACTCRRLTLDFSHQNNWEPTIPRVWDVESSHWNVIQHEGWIQSQVFFGMFMRTTRIHETNSALKPTVTNFKMQRTTNLELSLYKNASKQKAVETWFKPIKASGILEGKKGWNLESSPLNSIF